MISKAKKVWCPAIEREPDELPEGPNGSRNWFREDPVDAADLYARSIYRNEFIPYCLDLSSKNSKKKYTIHVIDEKDNLFRYTVEVQLDLHTNIINLAEW